MSLYRSKFHPALGLAIALIAGIGVTVLASYAVHQATPGPASRQSSAPSALASPKPSTISAGPAPAAPLRVPAGYVIHVFASSQGTARDLEFSPGGTLLVSDPKAATVSALPDRNHDGVADQATVILRGDTNPHGLAFHGGYLYVAETGRVVRYRWDEAALTATLDRELFKLPSPNPDHNRRTIVFDTKGQMYVSVGSTCNVCVEADQRSATIMTADADGHNARIYASGLRNAPFMAVNPATGDVWATEMGRDYLGDNLPPDEVNIIRAGQDYGWPICYGARVHDTQFDHKNYFADPCARTEAPVYAVPAHNAPLGLTFQQGSLFVAYHGSWNRSVPDGYKVVRLQISGNAVTNSTNFLTGFISGRDVAGRPVDITSDSHGSLYISDDKAGAVYIIQKG